MQPYYHRRLQNPTNPIFTVHIDLVTVREAEILDSLFGDAILDKLSHELRKKLLAISAW